MEVGKIYKLLISDRDKQEVLGIQWFISKYSLPISTIRTAYHLSDLLDDLENSLPDIACIELDMIAEDKWEIFKFYIRRYTKQVIALTAEPTFERAMQAMELQAIDLWVKPLAPPSVKHSLQQAIRNLSYYSKEVHPELTRPALDYESLFIEDRNPYPYPVYLLKTEYVNDLTYLRKFIEQFDFYFEPSVFSTSDRIVLVFHHEFTETFTQAQRFLREWELKAGSPLAIVVHSQSGEESLHQIYLKLRKVMETTFFTGYQQVFETERFHPWKDMDPFLTMEDQRKWVYMLEEARGNDIKKWMYEEFFDLVPPYPEPGLLRTRLTSILAQIRRFMDRNGMNSKDREEYYKNVFDKILYSPVLYRIVQDIILFSNYLVQTMEEQPSKVKGDAVEAAVSYMEKNFADSKLDLKTVAAHVGRSPSYLSHLLSKKYNRSFRDLLLSMRIQKAKELLSSDESVQNIARSIGFNNPNYFSRVFKEHTGQTPREYRRFH